MKQVAIFLFLLLFSTLSISTENSKIEKKFSGLNPSNKIEKSWSPIPFSLNSEGLPAGFKGTDVKKFLALFTSKVTRLKKGEFETSDDFLQRISDKDALLAPINTSDLYAFRVDDIDFVYDADAQMYKLSTSGERYSCSETSLFEGSEGWFTCKVTTAMHKRDKYLGSNAYGASTVIDRSRSIDYAIAISRSTYMYLLGYVIPESLSVSVEKARSLKNMNIAILFVGRVSDIKIINGDGKLVKPTIYEPTDLFIEEKAIPFELTKIIYYVVQTGEILNQQLIPEELVPVPE